VRNPSGVLTLFCASSPRDESVRRRTFGVRTGPRVAFAAESCAFGDSLSHRSEPDWHFQEKPIHSYAGVSDPGYNYSPEGIS
jgi:hypothetical protein